jgi:hypothetical protein
LKISSVVLGGLYQLLIKNGLAFGFVVLEFQFAPELSALTTAYMKRYTKSFDVTERF